MHIQVPHKLSKDAAVVKVKQALDENRDKIAAYAKVGEEKWDGGTLTFAIELQGKDITGTLEVTDADYVLDAKLPLLWRMFEGRIESEIEKQVKGM